MLVLCLNHLLELESHIYLSVNGHDLNLSECQSKLFCFQDS